MDLHLKPLKLLVIIGDIMKNRIIQILMDRDGMTLDDAKEMFTEAQEEVYNGEDPEEVLSEWFGLEPDYIFDLI